VPADGGAPEVVTAATLGAWPLPGPGADKEGRGRVLVVGGSTSTPGAVRLAGEAALRAGAGKLRLATAASATPALGVAVPEAAVIALPTDDEGHLGASAAEAIADELGGADAVLLGPGLKGPDSVLALLEELVPRLRGPAVLDALASAYVAEHPDDVPPGIVLTLNPGELEHLGMGSPQDVASRTGAVVLCGGTEKVVATPDGPSWVVRDGGHGLATSGSGDVQAGLVAGLLARGADPAQAAVWGGFLHARAGEELSVRFGPVGFLARELPSLVPGLLAGLR
jgi:ADP-dependent NAD(P)H-hydrate dehydratase